MINGEYLSVDGARKRLEELGLSLNCFPSSLCHGVQVLYIIANSRRGADFLRIYDLLRDPKPSATKKLQLFIREQCPRLDERYWDVKRE